SGAAAALSTARRRLVVDSLGIWVIAIIVGGIFGFTARQGGLSLVEAIAFSSILFAGASQYAAVGLLVVNTPWPSIVLLVWLLNARHLLYSASVAPYTAKLSLKLRAALAYLLTQPGVILHYLQLTAWPAGQCLDYDWPLATTTRQILLPGLVVLALLAATAVGAWHRRPWAWPGLAFFLLLAPTSSVLPVAAPAAEHRMYLPLAAVVAGGVLGLFALIRGIAGGSAEHRQDRPVWPWLFGGVTAVMIGVLIVATHLRNDLYADPEALWEDVLARRPAPYMANYALAIIKGRRGDLVAAEKHALEAVRSRPRTRIFLELSDMRARLGDAADSERLLRKGVALHEEVLPVDDGVRLTGRVLLANRLHDAGRDAEAEALCQPLLERLDAVLGEGHATTVTARTIVAYAARSSGDLAAAETTARDSLNAALRSLGPTDQATQSAAAALAKTLVDGERGDEATALLRDLLQRGAETPGTADVDVSLTARVLAEILERASDRKGLAEAEHLRRMVFESLQRRFPAGDRQLLRAEVALGNARGLVAV
ncbi:hypothetical protein EBR56_10625, partial [bacterium]|nr:hypothetical protein [bacterium]